MQPYRDRLICLRGSEGGHVAVGSYAKRRGVTYMIGVIRHPVNLACEQPDISTRRFHVPRQQHTSRLDICPGRLGQLICNPFRQH